MIKALKIEVDGKLLEVKSGIFDMALGFVLGCAAYPFISLLLATLVDLIKG